MNLSAHFTSMLWGKKDVVFFSILLLSFLDLEKNPAILPFSVNILLIFFRPLQ